MSINKTVKRIAVGGPLISKMTEAQVTEALALLDKDHAETIKRKAEKPSHGKAYRNCNRRLDKINQLRNLLSNRTAKLKAA